MVELAFQAEEGREVLAGPVHVARRISFGRAPSSARIEEVEGERYRIEVAFVLLAARLSRQTRPSHQFRPLVAHFTQNVINLAESRRVGVLVRVERDLAAPCRLGRLARRVG